MTTHALPRSRQQILNIAANAFSDTSMPFIKHTKSEEATNLKVLYETTELSLVGTSTRGFVIVSKDDEYAPVLGYSTK